MAGSHTMSTKHGIELLKSETLMLSQESRDTRRCIDLLSERYVKTLPYAKTLPVGTIDALINASTLLTDVTRCNDLTQERLYTQEQDYLEGHADPWADYAENLRQRIAVSKVDLWATQLLTEHVRKTHLPVGYSVTRIVFADHLR